MIEIELTEPKKSVCVCCGGENIKLTRFVYKDSNAFAIYHTIFSVNHAESGVIGIITVGDWESEDVFSNRLSFPFALTLGEDIYQVAIMNRDDCPWKDSDVVGRVLDRDEALSHLRIKEIFHITDHIVVEDTEIVNFFKLDSSAIN